MESEAYDTPLLVTTTPIVGHIRYGPWLGWCWLLALIKPLHSYPIWTLAGMVLAHGPDPTIAFVSDMAALARHRQGVMYYIHMFSHNRYGSGTKDQGLARAAIPDTNAMVESHVSQGPYRRRV